MAFALVAGGSATELSPGSTITLGDGTHLSYATLALWSGDERSAVNIFDITETEIPEGKVSTGSSLVVEGNVVTRTYTLADAPPPPVPSSITPAQAKAQLCETIVQEGEGEEPDTTLLDLVEAAVDAHPYPLVRIYWNNAQTFERSNAYINGIGLELGLSDADLDAMFTAAAARVF